MREGWKAGFFVSGVMFFLSCGGGAPDGGERRTLFLDAAKQTAPTFAAAAANARTAARGVPTVRNAAEFASGSPLFAAYNLMRDYEYPRDEGRIDMTNIYKALFEAGNGYARAAEQCTTIAERSVSSPYDFGSAATYDCAANFREQEPNYGYGCAIREEAGVRDALIGFKWAPDPGEQISLGTLQGRIEAATGEVGLDMVNLVSYPPQSAMGGESGAGFSVRTRVSGNSEDHTFELKSVVTGTGENASWTSIVGRGVSKGAGEHFLFRIWAGQGDTVAADGKYYCIEATADEAALRAMDQSGADDAEEACAAYKERVDRLAAERFSRTDTPSAASDFRDSSIYLNY